MRHDRPESKHWRRFAADFIWCRSNPILADMARCAALRELAAVGAPVWLAPGMVHAKAVLIDEDLALVGAPPTWMKEACF